MALKIKAKNNINQTKGTAMLRLKSSKNKPKIATGQPSEIESEVFRQGQIGITTSIQALEISTTDKARQNELRTLRMQLEQIFAAANKRLNIQMFKPQELMPDIFGDGKIDVVAARTINADRLVDMDLFAKELALVSEFKPERIDAVCARAKKEIAKVKGTENDRIGK